MIVRRCPCGHSTIIPPETYITMTDYFKWRSLGRRNRKYLFDEADLS